MTHSGKVIDSHWLRTTETKRMSSNPMRLMTCIKFIYQNALPNNLLTSVVDKGHIWEGRRSHWDCPCCSGREDELLQHRQKQPEQAWERNSRCPCHSADVEERVHSRVLPWQEIHECVLLPQQTLQNWRGQDVLQGKYIHVQCKENRVVLCKIQGKRESNSCLIYHFISVSLTF